MTQPPDDDQPTFFSREDMRPMFGGRQLRPGFETNAEPMPLFAPAAEAEREALAAMPTDQLMCGRGDAELFEADDEDPCGEKNWHIYARYHGLTLD